VGVIEILLTVAFLAHPSTVAAQATRQLQFDRVYTCELNGCTDQGGSCEYGGYPATCEAIAPGGLLCQADHRIEAHCCRPGTPEDCPDGTACVVIPDAGFGVCLGDGYDLTFCNDSPTQADVEACRGDFGAGHYDWGHGDCDGDMAENDTDPDPCSGDVMACPCNGDIVSGDAGATEPVDVADFNLARLCAMDPTLSQCVDVNCDGAVDYCDAEAVMMLFGRTAPDPAVCESLVCGTCVIGDRCIGSGQTVCDDMGGTFLGPGESCPTPPDPPDPTTSPTRFRGAGGCTCRTADAPPPAPLALLALWAVVRAERRPRR